MAKDTVDWNDRYAARETPWDSGEPSRELRRVVKERKIAPCRMLEIGCGTGTNAIWLARQGFRVTGVDVSPLAIEAAKAKARKAGVRVKLSAADILRMPREGQPYAFVFDRGVYHHLRTVDLKAFLKALQWAVKPGGLYLTLAGNANDTTPRDMGPPTVHAHDLCRELGGLFELVQLREFRFDGVVVEGTPISPLAWSALLRRKGR